MTSQFNDTINTIAMRMVERGPKHAFIAWESNPTRFIEVRCTNKNRKVSEFIGTLVGEQPRLKQIKNVRHGVDLLGGWDAVSELTGIAVKSLYYWQTTNSFPSRAYFVISDPLAALGYEVPRRLWAMIESAKPVTPTEPVTPDEVEDHSLIDWIERQ